MAANLQEGARLSVRDAARLMNVSERLVYMAKELAATGRADLEARVNSGELSMLAALKLAKPEKYAQKRSRYAALVKAWNACSDDERAMFAAKLNADQDAD